MNTPADELVRPVEGVELELELGPINLFFLSSSWLKKLDFHSAGKSATPALVTQRVALSSGQAQRSKVFPNDVPALGCAATQYESFFASPRGNDLDAHSCCRKQMTMSVVQYRMYVVMTNPGSKGCNFGAEKKNILRY